MHPIRGDAPHSDIPSQPRYRPKLFLHVVGLVIVGVSAYLFVRHIDGHALVRALGHARPSLLAVAGLLALGQLACRAGVFRTLLFPVVALPWLRVQRFLLATLGTFELGALAALQPFGMASELGLAVGLLYHMAQVLPIAALALALALVDSRIIAKG